MLHNSQNAYTTALIYPNFAAIRSWLADSGKKAGDEATEREIIQQIESQINQFLPGGKFEKMFPHRWLPASFALIGEGFTEDNHLLNSTMKIVRPKITEQFRERIEHMYIPAGKTFSIIITLLLEEGLNR
jgi:long-chain acyl-CoA synthetase